MWPACRLGRWPATDTMGPRTLGWFHSRPLTETQAVQDRPVQKPLLNMEQAGVAQGTKQALMTPWTQADRNPLALVQALVMDVPQAQVERDPVEAGGEVEAGAARLSTEAPVSGCCSADLMPERKLEVRKCCHSPQLVALEESWMVG